MIRVIYTTEPFSEGNEPDYEYYAPAMGTQEVSGLVVCDAFVQSLDGIDNIIGAWRENGVPVVELNEPVLKSYFTDVIEYDEEGEQTGTRERELSEYHGIYGRRQPAWTLSDMTIEQSEWLDNYILNGISEFRDELLEVEVTTNLSGGREVTLRNDDRTKTALASKRNTINNDTSISSMAFEARNGWFDLNYQDYQDLEVSLDLFTQSIFDAQRVVVENHSNSKYTVLEDAKSDLLGEL